MGPLWIAVVAALVTGTLAGLWRRRSIARRAECRRRFAAVLVDGRPGLTVVEAEPARWRLDDDEGPLATVDGKAVARAAERGGRDRRRLFLALADAARNGPRPFAGEFDLKRHGLRVLPRLADEGLALLALEPRAVRHTAADAAGLPTIYLVDGEPRPVYLTDEHLDGAGIDARDIHGVALAVLRQRFEEERVRAPLERGGVAAICSEDGCGGSRLLLLPEALGAGETLFAAAPAPDLLLVAADRAALDRALGERGEPAHPLPPAVFRATAGGLTLESRDVAH